MSRLDSYQNLIELIAKWNNYYGGDRSGGTTHKRLPLLRHKEQENKIVTGTQTALKGAVAFNLGVSLS